MSILRHVRNAEFFSLTRVGLSDILTLETDRARGVRAVNQSRQRFNQFGLAITLDTRDTDDLTLADLERNAIDTFRSVAARNPQNRKRYHRPPGFPRPVNRP